jgi:hypothetical protein
MAENGNGRPVSARHPFYVSIASNAPSTLVAPIARDLLDHRPRLLRTDPRNKTCTGSSAFAGAARSLLPARLRLESGRRRRPTPDRVFGSLKRLDFEGPSVVNSPLAQDKAARLAIAVDGHALDTVVGSPPLRTLELAISHSHPAKLRHLKAARDETRGLFVARQCVGILLSLALPACHRVRGTSDATP